MTQTASKAPASTWNKVVFTGNVGKDPEMAYTKNGTPVTKFSLAVNQGKDKPPMWLTVECWKQLAEQCNEKLEKGARVEIEGRLVQDAWEKDGHKRYALKVVAQTVRLLKRAESRVTSGGFIEEESNEDPLGDLDDHPF